MKSPARSIGLGASLAVLAFAGVARADPVAAPAAGQGAPDEQAKAQDSHHDDIIVTAPVQRNEAPADVRLVPAW